MEQRITSSKNSRIKNLILLQSKSRERKIQRKFVVEGSKELELLIASNYQVDEIYFNPDIISAERVLELKSRLPTASFFELAKEPFEKVAYREGSGGVIAVVSYKEKKLNDLSLPANPLILVAEAVEKPGNLGALLRTCDGVGADALIICDPLTDFYNPNVIRSSLGCVFTVQIASAPTVEVIPWLTQQQIQIFATALSASVPYETVDYTHASSIVVGTEATGLSDEWIKASNQNVIIPMKGVIDSLNVSVAAGVMMYEALRQRSRNEKARQ